MVETSAYQLSLSPQGWGSPGIWGRPHSLDSEIVKEEAPMRFLELVGPGCTDCTTPPGGAVALS